MAGSGVVVPGLAVADDDDDYDISGYDLSRYESDGAEPEEPLRLAEAESEPLRLTGADDPDAVEEDEDDDDDVVSSGAGGRRRSRRGTRRRTRP
jgi:ribonuclease E